jgi:hypothetical protein
LILSPDISHAALVAISRGAFKGEGGYAAAWEHNGVVLKLSRDVATCAMAQLLCEEPIPGLPVFHSFIEDVALSEGRYYDAFFMEKLKPLPAARFKALAQAYARARERAVARFKRVSKQSVVLASYMAEEVAAMQTRALTSSNIEDLTVGLCWLSQFMENGGFCADFGHRRNWMVNSRNEVVIADPVVRRIPELDAEGPMSTPLSE